MSKFFFWVMFVFICLAPPLSQAEDIKITVDRITVDQVFGNMPRTLGKMHGQAVAAARTINSRDVELADLNALTMVREGRKENPNLERLKETLNYNPKMLDSLKAHARGDFSDMYEIGEDGALGLEMVPDLGPFTPLVKTGPKVIMKLSEIVVPLPDFMSQENAAKTLNAINSGTLDRAALHAELGELYHAKPMFRGLTDTYVTPWIGISPGEIPIVGDPQMSADLNIEGFVKEGATWSKEQQEEFLNKMSKRMREENQVLQKNLMAQLAPHIKKLKTPEEIANEQTYKDAIAAVESIEVGMHGLKILGQVFEPKVASAIDKVGFPAVKITKKIIDMSWGDLTLRAGTMDVLGLVSDLLGALLSGPTPEMMIMDMIRDLQAQIADFRAAMEARLSRIDDKLDILLANTAQSFIDVLADFKEQRRNVKALQVQVAALSRAVRSINYSQNQLLQEGFLQDVTGSIQSCLEYKKNYKDVDIEAYKLVVKECINKMWECATVRSKQSLNTGFQNETLDFNAAESYSTLSDTLKASSQLNPYNHINYFLGAYSAFEAPGLAAEPTEVANPSLWATCASTYQKIAMENFEIYKGFIKESTTDANAYHQIQSMLDVGKSANEAMSDAFFSANNPDEDKMLNDLKLSGFRRAYESRVNALEAAITKRRKSFEGDHYEKIDVLAGAEQSADYLSGLLADDKLNYLVPSAAGFCDSVTPAHAESVFQIKKDAFNIALLQEFRQRLAAKLPKAASVSIKSGLGHMTWCVSEVSWSDVKEYYFPDGEVEIQRGKEVGANPQRAAYQAYFNNPLLSDFGNVRGSRGYQDFVKYRHQGVWQGKIGWPTVKLQGTWVPAAGQPQLVAETVIKSSIHVHIGDNNNWFDFGVFAGNNGFVEHVKLGQTVKDLWETAIQPNIADSQLSVLDSLKKIEETITADHQGKQTEIGKTVLADLLQSETEVALAAAELEALVTLLDVGLRFSMPQTRNTDNTLDELIYGPEGLFHQDQLDAIAASSNSALFDSTLKTVLMERFEKFQNYALKLKVSPKEMHPIIANSIQDLKILEGALNLK